MQKEEVILKHYGVLGMKRGVRKNRQLGTKAFSTIAVAQKNGARMLNKDLFLNDVRRVNEYRNHGGPRAQKRRDRAHSKEVTINQLKQDRKTFKKTIKLASKQRLTPADYDHFKSTFERYM